MGVLDTIFTCAGILITASLQEGSRKSGAPSCFSQEIMPLSGRSCVVSRDPVRVKHFLQNTSTCEIDMRRARRHSLLAASQHNHTSSYTPARVFVAGLAYSIPCV